MMYRGDTLAMIIGLVIRCFRVPDHQSYFSITQNNLPPCGNPSINPHCVNPWSEYRLKVDVTRACSRHKRQDEQSDKNDKENAVSTGEDFISLDEWKSDTKRTEVDDRELNMGYRFLDYVRAFNPRAKLSVEDGKSRCNDALKLSPTYELCSGRVDASAIVKSCALDVEVSW